jgi:hypothetical protein
MTEEESTEALLCDACRRVPLSHLSLDLPEPVQGWESFFDQRSVVILDDSAGRPSIPRWVLADLIRESKERERRVAEEAAQLAAALNVPVVGRGVPAVEGATPFESMAAAGVVMPSEEFGRPRPNFLEQELARGRQHQLAEAEAARRRKEKAKA